MLINVDVDAEVAAKVEGLEKALILTTNSREWNRKRVVELEDELERATGDRPSARDSLAGQVVQLEKSLAESRELVAFKERVADQIDQEADRLREALIKTRGDREEAERKVRDLERRNSELVGQANAQEALHAQVAADQIRSVEARDWLLAAATTRVKAAQEILSRPIVVGARNEIVTTKGAILADAIGNALDALSA